MGFERNKSDRFNHGADKHPEQKKPEVVKSSLFAGSIEEAAVKMAQRIVQDQMIDNIEGAKHIAQIHDSLEKISFDSKARTTRY